MSQVRERDLENLGKLLAYAVGKEDDVKRLSDNFAKKGFLGLLCDSKVPDKDIRLWYFFSLKRSNPDKVVTEMEIYQTFFKELSDAVRKVLDPEKMSDAEKEDPENEITNKLHENLLKIQKTAKEGILITSSSALYKLHQSFVEQYEELKNLITGTESVVLRKVKQHLLTKCNEANERINVLERKFNDLIDKHDETLDCLQQAVCSYKRLLEGQEKVVKENKELWGKVENLEKNNQEQLEGQGNVVNENKELRKKVENLEKKNQEQLEENQNLKREMKDLWEAISELRKK